MMRIEIDPEGQFHPCGVVASFLFQWLGSADAPLRFVCESRPYVDSQGPTVPLVAPHPQVYEH